MLIQRGAGTTILNGPSTYSGGTTPTAGVLAFGRDTVGSVDSGPIGTGPLLLAPESPNLTGAGNVLAFGARAPLRIRFSIRAARTIIRCRSAARMR